MMLDARTIRRRRGELGLSRRAVARHLGVSGGIIAGIEEGTNHEDLPLRLVGRLAELLAVHLPNLLIGPEVEDREAPGDKLKRLGALLRTADEPVAPETLADVLDWSLGDVSETLAQVDCTLRTVGMRLHHGPDGVEVVAEASRSDSQLEQLLRAQQARHGLTSLEVRLMGSVMDATLDTARLGNAEQVALTRLQNAGYLGDDHNVTDEVRYSLVLPRRGARQAAGSQSAAMRPGISRSRGVMSSCARMKVPSI